MKRRESIAFFDSEFQNSLLKKTERKKSNTNSKLHEMKGEQFSQSPLQATLNTIPVDQLELQYLARSNKQSKQNSSGVSFYNLTTQTQLIQTTAQLFHEKYEIIKILKESKQCQIVQCRNIFNKESVVAKICLQSQNFEINSEIKVNKTLKKYPHTNLMKLLEIITEKDTSIFIYEYMAGGTLYEFMQQKHLKLDDSEIKTIFKQLLKALKHLHSLNILHRDIKLDNIMFKTKGDIKSLKLIDFGFATFLSDNKNMEFRCGTPGYVAPEIYQQSNPYNQLCDIYSLGAVIHILATGKRIYSSKLGPKEICELNKKNQYVISENLKCPLLHDLISQMLKDAGQRPSVEQCLIHPYFTKLSELKNSHHESINQQIYELALPKFKNPFKSF
ncbi:unnamed protein product [Paramecium octaurelia]|uniref:Protein kinase domain-containing protein n=1 Tax=Paramecium octaurelia TaxID=43137 RepID=A0A8S1SWR6_PAROT|nr:unnamed protein product [Paramecium octaurelia]